MNHPLEGFGVVELAVGVTDLGLGLAGGVPGMLFAQLGASVTRVVGTTPEPLDGSLEWATVWHRDKTIVRTDDPEEISSLVAGADIVIAYGGRDLVEGRGLGADDAVAANPRLAYVRCAPSIVDGSEVPDFGLLVEARSGFCSQLAGHRDGPIFVDVRATGSGGAFLIATSALALLYQRELTGVGGAADTTLYDGMLATLGCMIGRAAGAPADVEGYWRDGSTFPNFLYHCADDELIQVWFGGKGMYATLIEVLGDEPSEQGYYADQISGQLQVRARRWVDLFRVRPRDEWIDALRARGVACEPVNAPGDALDDPHVRAVGLSTEVDGTVVLGSPISVEPLISGAEPSGPPRPLAGLRVVDFSAFVAGPLAAQVLADLGADVVKVEPPAGEAMRAAAYAVAACQRGKRSLALDLGAADARPAIDALLRWGDVVLHNFRVGVAERLGIDAATAASFRPDGVYCHASGFGPDGPRAKAPANDALMQALTGFEVANGGDGNEPIAGTWIPIDMAGGWVAAIGILAGLVGRARHGTGQLVNTSLLGAGLLLHSDVFRRSEVVRGPAVDAEQTGYGPGYRLYRTADESWIAVVLPGPGVWRAAADRLGVAAEGYTPLRSGEGAHAARDAGVAFADAIGRRDPGEVVPLLRAVGAYVEPVVEASRDQFRSGILDDEHNRDLGRVAAYTTPEWGTFEQIGPLLRVGPEPRPGPVMRIPAVGQHSTEVLDMVGLDAVSVDALIAGGVVVQAVPASRGAGAERRGIRR